MPVLIRKVIYDTMLTPPEDIADYLSLPRISEEVAEMEEQASEKRIEKISALIPFIDSHADIASRIAVAAYVIEQDEKVEVEEVESMHNLFRLVSLSSSLSCISTLVDMGLLDSKVISKEEVGGYNGIF
jgi:hypothetical protein